MLRAGIRRIAVFYISALGGTVGLSALLGLAAGAEIARAIALGLYVVGAVLLVGCFVFGVRGPLSGVSQSGDAAPVVGASRLRTASRDERSEATWTSILLFLVGLSLIVIGSVVDPNQKAF
jgi:hypothetical protein